MAADKKKKTDEMDDIFAPPAEDDDLFKSLDDPASAEAEPETLDMEMEVEEVAEPAVEEVSGGEDIGGLFDDSAQTESVESVEAADESGIESVTADDFTAPAVEEMEESPVAAAPAPAAKSAKKSSGGMDKKKIIIIAGAAVAGIAILGGAAMLFLGGSEEPEATVADESATQAAPEPATQTAAAPATEAAGAVTAPVAAPAPAVAAPAAAAPKPEPAKPEPAKPVAAAKPVPPPAPTPAPKPVANTGKAKQILSVRHEKANGSEVVRISLDGDAAGRFKKPFGMRDPERVIVDVKGVSKGYAGYQMDVASSQWVSAIRSAEHSDKGEVRVVVDFKGKAPKWEVTADGSDIVVKLR